VISVGHPSQDNDVPPVSPKINSTSSPTTSPKISARNPHQKDNVRNTLALPALQSELFSIETALENDDSEAADVIYKIIIIGNSGVGKTNLLGRWMTDKFSPTTATISVDVAFKTFIINQKKIKVQFWDTAGQEEHFALTTSYFRKSHGAIVVYDTTSTSSFFDIQKWVKQVSESAGNENTQFLLVGNKIDLEEQREVTTSVGMEFAKRIGLNFMETSAKNGDNVARAFQLILQDIHKIAQNPKLDSFTDGITNILGQTISVTDDNGKKQTDDSSCCF